MDGIARHALRLPQSETIPVYAFTLKASELQDLTAVSRLRQTAEGDVIGYQRPERRRHIANIAAYLNRIDAIMPNALTVALDPQVTFQSSGDDGVTSAGTIFIPRPQPGGPTPLWIVDGQQRTAAYTTAGRPDYPVLIIGFAALDIPLQCDQFLRNNNVLGVPPSLVTELLPGITIPISHRHSARQLPSALVDQFNRREDSPLYGLILRASTPAGLRGSAVITDSALIDGIEESLHRRSGYLFRLRTLRNGDCDVQRAWTALTAFWAAVRDCFPQAWGLPATRSRLMHGVGVRSLFRLFDAITTRHPNTEPSQVFFLDVLTRLAPRCHWTAGRWDSIDLPWNTLQNTPGHITLLGDHLIRMLTDLDPAEAAAQPH